MRIKSIKAENLKGQSFEHELPPVTIFVGKNATGKTARLDALRLILLGHIPALGATNPATFQLSSGSEMRVAAETDAGPIVLSWKASGESVKFKEEQGAVVGVPKVLVDCSKEFFSLSPEKRMSYVFDSVKMDSNNFSDTALLTKVKNIKAEDHTEAHQKALNDLANWVFDEGQVHSQLVGNGEEVTFQDWISHIQGELKNKVYVAKSAVDRMKKSLEGFTELNMISPTENMDLDQIEKDITKLREERDKVFGEIHSLKDSIKKAQDRSLIESKLKSLGMDPTPMINELALEIKKLEDEIAAIPETYTAASQLSSKLRNEYSEAGTQLNTLRMEAQKVETELRLYKESDKREELEKALSTIPDKSEELVKNAKEQKETNAEMVKLTSELQVLRERVREIGARHHQVRIVLDSTANALAEKQKKMDEVNHMESCPYCHSKKKGWQEEVIESLSVSYREHLDQKIISEKAIAEIEKEESEAKGKYNEIEQSLKDLPKKLFDLQLEQSKMQSNQVKRAEIQKSIASFEPKKVLEFESLGLTLTSRIKSATHKVEELKESLAKAEKEEVKAVETEGHRVSKKEMVSNLRLKVSGLMSTVNSMKELQSQLDAIPAIDANSINQEIDHANVRIHEINNDLTGKELLVKQSIAFKHESRRKQEAIDQLNTAKAEHEILKLAVNVVSEFQHAMVSAAFTPILSAANKIAGPILRYPLSYRDGDIGFLGATGKWVNAATFSGSEKSLSMAALGVALAHDSKYKFLCIDELGNLYPPDLIKFLHLMVQLTKEGVIDQFVGALPGGITNPPPGVQTIEVQ